VTLTTTPDCHFHFVFETNDRTMAATALEGQSFYGLACFLVSAIVKSFVRRFAFFFLNYYEAIGRSGFGCGRGYLLLLLDAPQYINSAGHSFSLKPSKLSHRNCNSAANGVRLFCVTYIGIPRANRACCNRNAFETIRRCNQK
jgi:hypothetical protein